MSVSALNEPSITYVKFSLMHWPLTSKSQAALTGLHWNMINKVCVMQQHRTKQLTDQTINRNRGPGKIRR